MKKVCSVVLTIFMLMILSSCQDHISNPLGIKIEGTKDWEVAQYSQKPYFLEGVTATDKQGESYTRFLEVVDLELKMDVVGSYQVTYVVTIDLIEIVSKKVSVKVVDDVITEDLENVHMFYLNDLHGAMLEDSNQMGLSKISNHINSMKDNHSLNVFIAGGDMLQGQMISNYFEGESVIRSLNAMNLDAFVMGNHEFDWGIENVLQYFNGAHQTQATYPLLGANIYDKRTGMRPEGIDPYTVIHQSGIKIGIIGVIGDGIESSIAKRFIENYEFRSAIGEVEKYTKVLREEELVDLVVVVNHHEDDMFNASAAKLDVDVIFNGHTHRAYAKTLGGKPVIQSGSSGSHLGYVKFVKDVSWKVSSFANLDSYDSQALNQEDQYLTDIMNEYVLIVDEASKEVLSKTNGQIDRNTLTNYVSMLMRIETDVDIAFHNYGGTRTALAANKDITLKDIYAVLPFDNVIVMMELKGKYIKQYINGAGSNYSQTVFTFEDETYYKVATNDYVYGADAIFGYAVNVELTNIVLRDLMVKAIRQQRDNNYTYFDTSIAYVAEQRVFS